MDGHYVSVGPGCEGDNIAEVPKLDDNSCHGRWGHGHFGGNNTGLGPGSSSFEHDASYTPVAENALGRI
jgi:hypothetical protein